MARAPAPDPALLTAEDLGILIGGLTAGDFWRFSEIADPEARNRAILEAVYRSALRKGIAPEGGEIADFLDRLEIGKLSDLFGLRVGKASAEADGASLPASAVTGGSHP